MGTPATKPGLYTTVKGSPHASRMTAAKHNEMNNNFVFMGDANLTHKPQFWVGLFNVSDLEQRVERPWMHTQFFGSPNAERRPSAKIAIIPPAREGSDWGSPFIIPDIVQMPEESPGNWRFRTWGQDGRFLAQDILNPEDPRGDWKTVRLGDGGSSVNEGTNLYKFGCFWMAAATKEELVPTDEMLAAAHRRLEDTYNFLIEDAKMLAMQGNEGIRQIGTLHRRAANYFGIVDVDWNRRYVRKIACPNCAEPISPTAAVCPKCPAVLDWQQAIALGFRTVQNAIDAGIIPAQAEQMAPAAPATGKKPRKAKTKA